MPKRHRDDPLPSKKKRKKKKKKNAPIATTHAERHRDVKPARFEAAKQRFHVPKNRFVTPFGKDKKCYDALRATAYKGFEVDEREAIPPKIHAHFHAAFRALDDAAMFRHDVTQPLGLETPCALTFVTRCLVGDPGITYKYLGVRMFSYPWRGDGATPGVVSAGVVAAAAAAAAAAPASGAREANSKVAAAKRALLDLGKLNRWLQRRSQAITEGGAAGSDGALPLAESSKIAHGAKYNMTLINRMEGCDVKSGKLQPRAGGAEGATVSRKLKKEPMFENERAAVSWHADSSLQHFTSIAVYHQLVESHDARDAPHTPPPADTDFWQLGLRVRCDAEGECFFMYRYVLRESCSQFDSLPLISLACDAEGPLSGKVGSRSEHEEQLDATPAVAVPLSSGCAYYLQDAFNHHHQHCVLAGSALRYASTHRVSRTDGHSYDSIVELCRSVLQRASGAKGRGAKQWRSEQQLTDTLEFEWLRQYYVQGAAHHTLHTWWHAPMAQLASFWSQLEARTAAALDGVAAAVETLEAHCSRRSASVQQRHAVRKTPLPCDDAAWSAMERPQRKQLKKRRAAALFVLSDEMGAPAIGEMLAALRLRQKTRAQWRMREDDPAFAKLAVECAPLKAPLFTAAANSPLFEDLADTIATLEEHRETVAIIWGESARVVKS